MGWLLSHRRAARPRCAPMEVPLTLLSSQQAPAFLTLLSQKFQEQLAISPSAALPLSPSLPLCSNLAVALLPGDEKEREWGQRRERKRGVLPEEDERGERSEGRGGEAGRGTMKFVWDTLDFYGYCAVPVSSHYSLTASSRKNASGCT